MNGIASQKNDIALPPNVCLLIKNAVAIVLYAVVFVPNAVAFVLNAVTFVLKAFAFVPNAVLFDLRVFVIAPSGVEIIPNTFTSSSARLATDRWSPLSLRGQSMSLAVGGEGRFGEGRSS